jgi:hypothetical protein
MGMNLEKKTKTKAVKSEPDIVTLKTTEDPSFYLAKGYKETKATRVSIILERKGVVKVKKVAAGESTFHKLLSTGYRPFEENATHIFLEKPTNSRSAVASSKHTRKSRYGMSMSNKIRQRYSNRRDELIKSRRRY